MSIQHFRKYMRSFSLIYSVTGHIACREISYFMTKLNQTLHDVYGFKRCLMLTCKDTVSLW